MTRLKILSIRGECGVKQEGIEGLDLQLAISGNYGITCIGWMINLKVLDASSPGYIISECLPKLTSLEELDLSGSSERPRLDMLTKLKSLTVSDRSRVDQVSIQGLNLYRLLASDNQCITNVCWMTNLRVLDASGLQSKMSNESIAGLNMLEELNVTDNKSITRIRHMTNLKRLMARGDSGVDQFSIEVTTGLIVLSVSRNKKITDVSHLTRLRVLDIAGSDTFDEKTIPMKNLVAINDVSCTKLKHTQYPSNMVINGWLNTLSLWKLDLDQVDDSEYVRSTLWRP